MVVKQLAISSAVAATRMGQCAPWLVVLMLFAGCQPSGPHTVPVSGTVRWDGAPLASGDILFHPVDGGGVPDAGKITDGQFTVDVKPGMKKIAIYATRSTGEVDPTMGAAAQEQFIPARYNDTTELTQNILDQPTSGLVFELVP